MRLWKRVAGALKDQHSICLANFSRRTALRNPEVAAAVIKATSHDEFYVDYRNAQKVFAFVRMSASYLKPIVWAISMRVEKTRSWIVVLKGLMLMHGVFCCRVPAVRMIGRLPFDLSAFKDGNSDPAKMWAHNAFIRAYFAFLDQKSTFLFLCTQEDEKGTKQMTLGGGGGERFSMAQYLLRVEKLQRLLDLLLQIKPQHHAMIGCLVLEAMDCIFIGISDIYSKICNGIAKLLLRIYLAGKAEASMALEVLQKANQHGEELASYFDFCKHIGVINALDCPKIDQILEEDIHKLQQIINGVSEEKDNVMLVGETQRVCEEDTEKALKTIITNTWEVFDEDFSENINGETTTSAFIGRSVLIENPFVTVNPQPLHVRVKSEDLPDLITW